jgi:hypothetical protein
MFIAEKTSEPFFKSTTSTADFRMKERKRRRWECILPVYRSFKNTAQRQNGTATAAVNEKAKIRE